jgi:cellulose synthase/poly-beta-1,6-N-acetylglucosamine synthase-like glycosyltransferase
MDFDLNTRNNKKNNVPDDWPPSSRSAAFTKKVWKKSGGYPEELYTAEDSIFNYRLKAIGARFKVARGAKSYWRPRANFSKFFKQYFTYARGNGEALLALKHYPENRILLLFWFWVLFGIVAYFSGSIIGYVSYIIFITCGIILPIIVVFIYCWRELKKVGRACLGLGLSISAFIANILGNHYGILRRALGLVKVKKVKNIKIVK